MRAHLEHVVTDPAKSNVSLGNAAVYAYQRGTTTDVADMTSDETGLVAVTNPLISDPETGEIECWLADGQSIDLKITDNAATAFDVNRPTKHAGFDDYTVKREVYPAPEDLGSGNSDVVVGRVPTDLANLEAWFGKQDSDIGRPSDAAWFEESGNARHMTLFGGEATVSMNGRDAVQFDGVNDFGYVDDVQLPLAAGPLTISIALRQNAHNQGELFGKYTDDTVAIEQGVTSGQLYLRRGATRIGPVVLPIGEIGVITCVIDGANSSIRLNDGAPVTGTLAATALTGFYFGSGFNTYVASTFGEGAIYSRHLDEDEMDSLIAWLAHRWGATTTFVSVPPTWPTDIGAGIIDPEISTEDTPPQYFGTYDGGEGAFADAGHHHIFLENAVWPAGATPLQWRNYPPPWGIEDLGVATVNGQMHFYPTAIPHHQEISGIRLYSGATAMSGCDHIWVALFAYHPGGVATIAKCIQTVDVPGDTWLANSFKDFEFPEPCEVPGSYGNLVTFIGLMIDAAQPPSLMGYEIPQAVLGEQTDVIDSTSGLTDLAPDTAEQHYYANAKRIHIGIFANAVA